MIDLEEWYTEGEAAAKLALSPRTFRRFIAAGKYEEFAYAPERKRRPREGKKPETVYNPKDVDTLASVVATKDRTAERTADAVLDPREVTRELLLEFLISRKEAHVVANNKLYLTVKEAAAFSGLPKAFLRRIAPRLGFLVGRNSWRFPKSHLADSDRVAKLAGLLLDPPPEEDETRWEMELMRR